MTKLQAVIEWIQAHGEGYTINQRNMDDIVLSLNVSPSTVRRAMKELRHNRVMTKNVYHGKKFVRIDEVVAVVGDGAVLSEHWYDVQAKNLNTTAFAISKALQMALDFGAIKVFGTTGDGLFVRKAEK